MPLLCVRIPVSLIELNNTAPMVNTSPIGSSAKGSAAIFTKIMSCPCHTYSSKGVPNFGMRKEANPTQHRLASAPTLSIFTKAISMSTTTKHNFAPNGGLLGEWSHHGLQFSGCKSIQTCKVHPKIGAAYNQELLADLDPPIDPTQSILQPKTRPSKTSQVSSTPQIRYTKKSNPTRNHYTNKNSNTSNNESNRSSKSSRNSDNN